MTTSKKIAAGSFLFLLVVGIGLYIAIQSIDLESYKPRITSEISQLTGRTFDISGPVELDAGFNTVLRFNKLALGNSEAAVSPYFATIETLEAEVKLLPLIYNELVISNVLLDGVKVWLEVDQKGRANWDFNNAQQSSETSQSPETENEASNTVISALQIKNTSIFYQNHDQPIHQLDIDSLTVNMNEADQALRLVSSLQLNNKPLQFTAKIDSVEHLLSSRSTRVTLNGDYDGKVFDISTFLGLTDSRLKLDDLVFQLNGESLSAVVDYQWTTEKPSIHADIKFDTLDLNHFRSASTTSQKNTDQKKTDKLFTSEVIDLSWMNENNLDFKASGQQLVYNNLQMSNIILNAEIKKGKLIVTPAFIMGEGEVKGAISLDAAADTPILDVNLDGNNIQLGKVNVETQTGWIQQSKTRFNIKATSTGNSPAQLASNLKGRFFVDIGKGKIKNEHLDLVGGDLLNELFTSLDPASAKDDYTQLQCAVINLRFKNGVARYDKDIAAMTDKMMIVSAGEINLKNETLDIGFSPQPRKDSAGVGINVGELVSLAKLTGKLTDPELGLDAANTAKVGAKAYGAIATGGISLLLDGLVSKIIADDDPCQTARGAGAKKQQKASSQKSGGLKSLFGF